MFWMWVRPQHRRSTGQFVGQLFHWVNRESKWGEVLKCWSRQVKQIHSLQLFISGHDEWNISTLVLNLRLRFNKLRVFTKPAFWNKSPDNCRVYYDQHSAFWSLWWRKTGITACMSTSSTRSPRSLRLQSQGLETGWQPPGNHCVPGKNEKMSCRQIRRSHCKLLTTNHHVEIFGGSPLLWLISPGNS